MIRCGFSWPRSRNGERRVARLQMERSVGGPAVPDDFDRDYPIGRPEPAGMAHVSGTVIRSVPSLRHSFASCEDPYHVGFHQFAHLPTATGGNRPICQWASRRRRFSCGRPLRHTS